MDRSSPTPSTARPRTLPHQIDSSSRVVSSPAAYSPAAYSPATPSSVSSPAEQRGAAPNYFSYAPHGHSERQQLFHSKRFSVGSSSTRRADAGSRSPPTSAAPPLPTGGQRPKSLTLSSTSGYHYSQGQTQNGVTSPTNLGRRPDGTGTRDKRASGTYTQCGRHSNDWLFGGVSVRDTVRGLFEERK